jgi:mannose/fructose/N-acetylgalactosamine-specific phosphotransferase system component IID
MAAVNIREGVRYGASLLGYFVVLVIGGGIVVAIGFALFTLDNIVATLIGFVFYLVGLVIFYAGFLGIGYKVIADGVARGIQSVQATTSGAETGGMTASGGLIDSITRSTEDRNTERSEGPRTRE